MTGNGNTRGLGPVASLPVPRTPERGPRKELDGIDDLVRSLEERWQIGLKLRGDKWSPRRNNADDKADKVFGLIKFLFHQNPPALRDVIESFQHLDVDTFYGERLTLIHKTLKTKSETIQAEKSEPVSRAGTPQNKPAKYPASWFLGRSKTSQPAGQRYNAQASRSQLNVAEVPGSPTDEDTDTEYQTAPRSPSRSLTSTSSQRRSKASRHVPSFSHSSIPRKRPSDSSEDLMEPSKLTKSFKAEQTDQSCDSGPIPYNQFKKPTLEMARSFQAAPSVQSSANTSFNNTTIFSSQETANTTNTSFTSYDGANEVRGTDIRPLKLKRTSSTTMGSLDDYDLIRAATHAGRLNAEVEVDEQDIQRDLNQVFSQEGSHENRSTFGSIDEDDLRDISCEVEEKQTGPRSMQTATARASTVPRLINNNGKHAMSIMEALPPPKVQPQTPAGTVSPTKMTHHIRNMPDQNLFVPVLSESQEHIPYFILFICQRIAIDSCIKLEDIVCDMDVAKVTSDHETFWSFIDHHPNISHIRLRGLIRESSRLWQAGKREFDGYTFKGNITLSPKSDDPVVQLQLLPVQADESCRLQRMFGSDRFLYLNSPIFKTFGKRRFNEEQWQQIRGQWQRWLLKEHSFLGRKWRVFHMKDLKRNKTVRRKDAVPDKRIVLFATEGLGIKRPCSVGTMLNQFLPFFTNQNQGFCKAFARIDLGLTPTVPTLCFERTQIFRARDQLATQDNEDTQFNDPYLTWQPYPRDAVMNDGCCIISVGAARLIWQLYKKATGTTGPLPSSFQGRIAGAKGLWMLSAEPTTNDPHHLDIWIVINDSQWKFDPPDDCSSNHHRTFGVRRFSSPPTPNGLHILFIPILVDRGVPREVIADLMSTRLNADRAKLLEMLDDPVTTYIWVCNNGRRTQAGIEPPRRTAVPDWLEERVKLMLESGFSPVKSPYLAKDLEWLIQNKQILQESKLGVLLSKSTFLFGVADPVGVLEPGEIQVRFSTSFDDESTDDNYNYLQDLEVLVARQPACRRSDIQKVRTVIRGELSHLVDVVVFPSKGQFPLAGKLQGGDYDGDTFWICWQTELVQPFKNAQAPVQDPKPAMYGIETRTEKLRDIMDVQNPDEVDKFLGKAFEFRSNPSLLGLVTIFAEKQAYSENRMSSDTLERLYDMHDLLVDAPKQGYLLTQASFDRFLRSLPKKPGQPAYKAAIEDCTGGITEVEKCRERKYKIKRKNILDYLYFDVLRAHNIDTITQIKAVFSQATERDETLLYPSRYQSEKRSETIQQEIMFLNERLEHLYRDWCSIWHKELTAEKYDEEVGRCYQSYCDLQPRRPDDPQIKPWVEPYLRPGTTIWNDIKASALYAKYPWPEKSKFVFHMAGKELTKLKGDSFPDTRAIISKLRTNMKPRPVKTSIQYDESDDEDDFASALEEPMWE